MSVTADIRELVEISQFAGRDVLLAQGGGGNTSVKSGDGRRMWIKASGHRLSEVGERHAYLETDLPALLSVIRDPKLAELPRAVAHEESVRRIQAAVPGPVQMRPSLETGFHAVLGRRVVLHTHPVYVNAFTCMDGGAAALEDALGEQVIWVKYEPPGYALAAEVDRVCMAFQQGNGALPAHIMLANHGLIASGQSGAGTIATTLRFVEAGKNYFGPLAADSCAKMLPPEALIRWAEDLEHALRKRRGERRLAVRPACYCSLLQAADAPDQWLTPGPLVPDDVVYSGENVWIAEASYSPRAWLDALPGPLPEKMIVAVPGLGVVLAGQGPRMLDMMEENLLAHVLVRQLIARRGGKARRLPAGEVGYLLNMESEKYRQAMGS